LAILQDRPVQAWTAAAGCEIAGNSHSRLGGPCECRRIPHRSRHL